MLLRRVSKHVREENWFAIGIDFVIVVVGVFIGMQVSNWNSVRAEKALERQYLERLSDDIRQSAQRAEENIASHHAQFSDQNVILGALSSCELSEETRPIFVRGIIQIGQFDAPSLVRGSIDELRSTGRMGIISNLELRTQLTTMYDSNASRAEILGYIIERMSPQGGYVDARRIVNFPSDDAMWREIEPDWVTFDFESLCRDPLYAGAISSIQFTTNVTLGHHRQMLERYEEVLQALDEELGVASED